MLKKIIIIDPFLKLGHFSKFNVGGGHDEDYDFSIAREALNQRIKTEVWCQPQNTNRLPDFVKPKLKQFEKRSIFWNFFELILRTFELRKFLKKIDENTILLFQNVKAISLPALFLATPGIKVKPKIVIVLRRGVKDDFQIMNKILAMTKYMLTRLFMKALYKRKNAMFVSDSKNITDELTLLKFNSRTLPIPHIPFVTRLKLKKHSKKIIIGYFGGARFDKGFDLLPSLVNEVIKKNKNCKFILHTYIQKTDNGLVDALEKLQKIQSVNQKRICLINKKLSRNEYNTLLMACDIVLLSYRREYYGMGTSGIAAEAIALGKWIIAPEKTRISAQDYDKKIIFKNLSVNTLNKKIKECIKLDKKMNNKRIREQIKKFCKFHSSKKYIEILKKIYKDGNNGQHFCINNCEK